VECPVCNVEFRVSRVRGIEIDYCPRCGGLWLNREEFEKVKQLRRRQKLHKLSCGLQGCTRHRRVRSYPTLIF
jgi:Zn-finger nucleic acid-binding protein